MTTEMPAFLRSVVTELAGEIGARPHWDLSRLERAAGSIERRFAACGCSVSSPAFGYRGRTYRNLVAEFAGTETPRKLLEKGDRFIF